MRLLSRLPALLIGVLILAVTGSAVADDGSGKDGKDSETPVVLAVSATDVGSSSALMRAYVNPSKHSTTYVFEYGTTTAYGSSTASTPAGSSEEWQAASAHIEGLLPETLYHYRVVATNSKGTTLGTDRTFTTLSVGGPGEGTGSPDAPAQTTPVDPEIGASVAMAPADGTLRVRLPGSITFHAFRAGSELPLGSELDASHGIVSLTAALPSGKTQTGRFGGGRFVVRQDRHGLVDLYLRGPYCTRPHAKPAAAVAVAAAARRPVRRLWGRDRGGRFRTHGRNSHATVRGTRWLVEDRCDGTLTRVTAGSVVVRDNVRRKNVVVRAGHSYLARPRR